MKKILCACLGAVFIAVSFCSCNFGEIMSSEFGAESRLPLKTENRDGNADRGEVVFKYGNSRQYMGVYYDNTVDLSKVKKAETYPVENSSYTEQMAKGMLSRFPNGELIFDNSIAEDAGSHIRRFGDEYYIAQRTDSSYSNQDSYCFYFYGSDANLKCIYRIEQKLRPFKSYNLKAGKTTADDLKELFPYDDFSILTFQNEESYLMDLQFSDTELQLVFEEKNGKAVLKSIEEPYQKFVIAEHMLPQDLALIT